MFEYQWLLSLSVCIVPQNYTRKWTPILDINAQVLMPWVLQDSDNVKAGLENTDTFNQQIHSAFTARLAQEESVGIGTQLLILTPVVVDCDKQLKKQEPSYIPLRRCDKWAMCIVHLFYVHPDTLPDSSER